MVSVGRYYYFVNNTKSLEKIQARLEVGKHLERDSELRAQEAEHNRALDGAKFSGILTKYI